jgi:BirA family transcriptional regulator, biotin operon repressor / biotin---[acetyl-CoA-carboxylase] ligase
VKANSSSQRVPLSAAWLQAELVRPGGFWRAIQVVEQTGSTHDDLLAAARRGTAQGTVLVAEDQSAGRGRMGRSWVSPPRAGLTFSVLLRPAAVPAASRGWVPLLAGVAIAAALRAEAGLDAGLKWPNDVLVNEAKLAGILAEQAGDAIVVGAGINVTVSHDELPAAETTPSGGRTTSLVLEGATLTDRGQLLVFVLDQIEHWYLAWAGASGDAAACGLQRQYQGLCQSVGREVRAQLPGGQTLTGVAREVDDVGQLLIQTAAGLVPVSAGDLVHLR